MASNTPNDEAIEHGGPSSASEASINKLKKVQQEPKGGIAGLVSSTAPFKSTGGVTGGQAPKYFKVATQVCDDLGANNLDVPTDYGQQVTNTAGSVITNPQSLSGGRIKSRQANLVMRDFLNTAIREAHANGDAHMLRQLATSPQGYAERNVLDDGASITEAPFATSRQTQFLYNYQIDRIAKRIDAAKKDKLEQEKFNTQCPSFATLPAGPAAGVPDSDPHLHLGRRTRRAPSARGGPSQVDRASAQATKTSESFEDICNNMDKLIRDDAISDRDFAVMRYGNYSRRSRKDLRDTTAPSDENFPVLSECFTKPHSRSQFLYERAESSAHAKRMGDKLPRYAYTRPENGKPARKEPPTLEELAAKSAKEFDESNRDYDEAFARNLRGIFD